MTTIPDLDQLLRAAIAKAFLACYNHALEADGIMLQATRKDFAGDRTLVTFAYTKALGKGPEQIGQTLGEWLVANVEEVVGYNVVKGFLNLEVADSFWANTIAAYQQQSVPGQWPANGEKVLVEFSSPNTNKPQHLGHLRTNFLGYSVAQILKAYGHEVITCNLVNDRGIHICKSMLAYQRLGNGETPESSGIKGDHFVGKYYVAFDRAYKAEVNGLMEAGKTKEEAEATSTWMSEAKAMLRAWEAGDPEVLQLWELMNSWVLGGFKATYDRLGITFDQYYYESQTYLLGKDIVEEGLAKGVFYQKEDNSVWCDLTDIGLDQKLVLRSDGTSVYMTQDLGTSDMKYQQFGAERSIYVVGNEQDYHFKVLFGILTKLGRSYAPGMHHLSYGMVNLPSGRMKSREGTVVDADDLLTELETIAEERTRELGKIEDMESAAAKQLFHDLGEGAIKYYLLKVDPVKTMLFNPEESVDFQGNTATFIQYTHARISSIKRKAEQLGIDFGSIGQKAPNQLHPAERTLALQIADFKDVIKNAALSYSPALVANYLYDLAKAYNSFFAECPVFKAESQELVSFRAQLSELTGRVIKQAGLQLGISMPERM